LSRFLQFVVDQHLEGKDGEIKESVIALEVFGRGPYHDPKQDSIVRTEAARLRARLAEYYGDEGKNDALVIEMPKGGYAPIFRQAAIEPAMTRSGPAVNVPRSGPSGFLEMDYSGRMETRKSIARRNWHAAAAWMALVAIAGRRSRFGVLGCRIFLTRSAPGCREGDLPPFGLIQQKIRGMRDRRRLCVGRSLWPIAYVAGTGGCGAFRLAF
jgi:hypothetical protein